MLLVIGLDGATWDLVDPWIERGALPNLARLREAGLHGALQSTMPPATMPAWTSFATACNPGKHGIFDFTRRIFGSYEVNFVNSTFRKRASIWRQISETGRKVAVLGVPGTYPPEDLNGCMISGFDTPVTTRADDSFVSPRHFASEVRAAGGFPFADFQEFAVDDSWYRQALARLIEGIEKKVRLAKSLLRREAWDCFVLVFGESDTVAHHFWQFLDPQSPRFDAERAESFGDAVLTVYRQLDAAVGEIEAAARPAASLVLSDHGFGGAGRKVVYLNRCLQELGFQRREETSSALAAKLKRLALTKIPAAWQARAFRLNGGRWASRLESKARFAGIDWEGSAAFSEELNYFPSIWLNLRGREPLGTIEPREYDRTRDEVCLGLESLIDPTTGRQLVKRAWRRDEIYHGPCVAYAPDIVVELNLDAGYSYNCQSSAGSDGPYVRELGAKEIAGGKLSSMSGSHRRDGLFLLTGSGCGLVHGARIEDMGATVLAHFGLGVADLDGRVWSAAPVTRRANSPTIDTTEAVYDSVAEAEIESRLGALGYL